MKKLPYVSNLFNLLDGVTGLIYTPYKQTKEDGNLAKGIKNGIVDFFSAVAIQGVNLTQNVVKGTQFGLN